MIRLALATLFLEQKDKEYRSRLTYSSKFVASLPAFVYSSLLSVLSISIFVFASTQKVLGGRAEEMFFLPSMPNRRRPGKSFAYFRLALFLSGRNRYPPTEVSAARMSNIFLFFVPVKNRQRRGRSFLSFADRLSPKEPTRW